LSKNSDAVINKWITVLHPFCKNPALWNWLVAHNEQYSDISPISYNKLGIIPKFCFTVN